MHETTRYGVSPLSWCAQPMTRVLQWAAVLTVLFAAAVYVLVNLAVDVSYAVIDPRIRYR